jgi:hypothetical protein
VEGGTKYPPPFELSAAELEKLYECVSHPTERVKFYCQDCYQTLCSECIVKHNRSHTLFTGTHDCNNTRF